MNYLSILFAAAATILGIIFTVKSEQPSILGKVFLVVGILSAILIIVTSIQAYRKEKVLERINANFGDVKDLVGAKIPQIAIGHKNSPAVFQLNESALMVDSNNQPLLKAYIKDSKLLVNALIYGLNGKIIAAIEENTWTIFDKEFEYNDDNRTAFELVTKGERKVFFQIQLYNGMAYIAGHILSKDGYGVIFYAPPNKTEGGAMHIIRNENDKKDIPDSIHVERLFKYPREKYYGKFK